MLQQYERGDERKENTDGIDLDAAMELAREEDSGNQEGPGANPALATSGPHVDPAEDDSDCRENDRACWAPQADCR